MSNKPKPNPALTGVSDATVECRGGEHDFPRLRVGPLPKGIRPVSQRDGSYQLVFICGNCGRERTKTTLPGGFVYDRGARYQYRGGPDDFSARPGSDRSGLRRADYTAELYRRVAESNAARLEALTRAVAAAAEITGPPEARFSGTRA